MITKKHKIYAEVLEEEALSQFESAMEQEFVIEGALMPDAHTGYALPIGAVVATREYIVPSWIGFDIGCTDADTEYLTKSGWKRIADYGGEEIMQYNSISNECNFNKPICHIVNDCKEFYHLKSLTVDQMLTPDHRVILFPVKKGSKSKTRTLLEWMDGNNQLKKGVSQQFNPTIPLGDCQGISKTDDEIRMLIAISADGTIRSDNRVEFHFKKERKVERLKKLAKACGMPLSQHNKTNGNYGFTLTTNSPTKSLSELWLANKQQLSIVVDEVGHWDGHIRKDGRIAYSTTVESNADVIQYAFSVCGYRSGKHRTTYNKPNWNDTFTVYTCSRTNTNFPKPEQITKVPSVDGKSYCFTTQTGYWVMRRNGRIAITGNCGMCALKLEGIDLQDVLDKSEDIFESIYEQVPVGFNINNKDIEYDNSGLTEIGREIADKKKYKNALGSLGGGNHFIEVGYDENEDVWVIIHCGSRGVGHGLATHYMKLANPEGKAKDGHWGFDTNSQDGKDYIQDMNFALDYALANRKEIMTRVVKCITESLEICCYEVDFSELINRNHNHAVYVGEGVWIHRKGATHAEDGMMGVIPGNMRDGSFIVRGKGNRDSLMSSSHGAGRILGRKQAKRELTVEQFEATMIGIRGKVDETTLDESPFAYKNIFDVMKLQEDLVEVVAHIKPVINIKG